MGIGMQCFAAFASSFGSLMMGMLYSWPSYTLDLYSAANTTLLSSPMTEMECSLVGSLPPLGAMVGTLIAGPTIEKIGRQKGGVAFSLPYLIAWAIIYVTSRSTVILAARFIMGIAGGAFLVYAPIFISETAQDSIRGFLAAVPIGFFCLGNLLSYLFGWFLFYRTIIWANLFCSVLCTLFCYLLVESPIYLVRQGRDYNAREAIARYKGGNTGSKKVIDELCRLKALITPAVELSTIGAFDEKKIEEEDETENLRRFCTSNGKDEQKISALKYLCVSPSSRRAFAVVLTHITLQVFMGVVPVTVYAKTLFTQAAPSLSGHFCSVLFATMLFSGCIAAAIIADQAGRRVLLISSSILVGCSMATLACLLQTRLGPAWIAAVVILVYCFFFNLGAGSIPYVLLAESFLPEVQGVASMLIVEWVWFLNFAIIALFPVATKLIGITGVFYFFAAVAISNAAIGFFWVPETKGLSNEQIQEAYLRRGK